MSVILEKMKSKTTLIVILAFQPPSNKLQWSKVGWVGKSSCPEQADLTALDSWGGWNGVDQE